MVYGYDNPDHQTITQNRTEANLCVDRWKKQDMSQDHVKECMSEIEPKNILRKQMSV